MKNICSNCGIKSKYIEVFPIDYDLKATWQLSDHEARLFNAREGLICESCGASVRAQGLAKAILQSEYGFGQKSLYDWVNVANKKKLRVCELNSCHKLHDTLMKLNNLTYAEYGTPSEQNIESLTYKDNQFDLMLHSETLEHINNPGQAMDECRRVIKSNGIVLFTVPIIWNRKTRQRAVIENKQIKNILTPSYHGFKTDDYMVFYEYGRDVDTIIKADVAFSDWRHQNYVFISGKAPTGISVINRLKLRMMEYIAIKGDV